tara:strand:- start:48 stop:224 length:177 start_codon:yes stop_codon:yes gene_type:complete
MFKKIILGLTFIILLQGCGTTVAVVDTTASTVIYTAKATVKTAVNVVDAITPDILNDD